MRKLVCSMLGLLSAITFFIHSIYASGLMLGLVPFSMVLIILGMILGLSLLLHALLGLIPVWIRNFSNRRKYLQENSSTLLQQLSGLLVIGFTFYHTYYMSHKPSVFSLFLMILMLIAIGYHIYIGLPKCLITLGRIDEEEDMKKARIYAIVLGLLPMVLCIIAYIMYYPNYYAG